MRKRIVSIVLTMILLLALTACNQAQAPAPDSQAAAVDFPTKDITIICPFGAGGGTDAMGRKIAEIAQGLFDQNVLVVNKTGGSGAVGMGEGSAARPDGYTITMATVEINLLPLAELATFTLDDFKPVILFNYDADGIFVRADSKYQTLEELIADAKANPGKVSLMVSGFPSHLWMVGAMLQEQADVEFNLIPEAGGAAEQIQSLLGGHVDATIVTVPEGLKYVNSGDFRALVTCEENAIESVPTFKAKNYDIEVGTWRGLVVPKDTPDHIVNQLSEVFTQVYEDPSMQEFLQSMSFGARYMNSTDFSALIQKENKEYAPIIEKYKELY